MVYVYVGMYVHTSIEYVYVTYHNEFVSELPLSTTLSSSICTLPSVRFSLVASLFLLSDVISFSKRKCNARCLSIGCLVRYLH